ncbi:MAG: hypothetical protein ABIH00_01030 [Armatimonadota bacterium]
MTTPINNNGNNNINKLWAYQMVAKSNDLTAKPGASGDTNIYNVNNLERYIQETTGKTLKEYAQMSEDQKDEGLKWINDSFLKELEGIKEEDLADFIKTKLGDNELDSEFENIANNYNGAYEDSVNISSGLMDPLSQVNIAPGLSFPELQMPTMGSMPAGGAAMPSGSMPGIPSMGAAAGSDGSAFDKLGEAFETIGNFGRKDEDDNKDSKETTSSSKPGAAASVKDAEKAPVASQSGPIAYADVDQNDLHTDKMKESINGVSGKFDESGNYILKEGTLNEKIGQIENDIKDTEGAKENTEKHFDASINSKGNEYAKNYIQERNDKIVKDFGELHKGNLEDLVKGGQNNPAKIPQAQKEETEGIKNTYGLKSEDSKNKEDFLSKHSALANKENLQKNEVESALKDYNKDTNIGNLQGKESLAKDVETKVEKDKTKFENDKNKAETDYKTAEADYKYYEKLANSAEPKVGVLYEREKIYAELKMDKAKTEKEAAEKEIKRTEDILSYLKSTKPSITERLNSVKEERGKKLSAITNGTSEKTKAQIDKKKEEKGTVNPEANKIAENVKNKNYDAVTEPGKDKVEDPSKFTAMKNNIKELNKQKEDALKSFTDIMGKMKELLTKKKEEAKKTGETADKIKGEEEKAEEFAEIKDILSGIISAREALEIEPVKPHEVDETAITEEREPVVIENDGYAADLPTRKTDFPFRNF